MRGLIRACVFATLLSNSLFFFGCSQGDPASVEPPSARGARLPVSSADARKANVPTGDPCALLIDDEVNKVFPGAAPGKRNRSLDGHGILTCTWDTPTDRFVVQVFDAKSGSVEDELRSRISGSIDPTMARAVSEVRYETISGVGDEAMLALEKADSKRGILADTAVLVTQRGKRRAVLFTGSSLAASDRASALKALETLGKQLAARL
jgi:hypothetical protein